MQHISHESISVSFPNTRHQTQLNSIEAGRRRPEDKMAVVLIVIVTVWLITNLPRICLDFEEVLSIETMHACMEHHPSNPYPPFPPWTLMLDPFSHLLLVINSSINVLLYGKFDNNFRDAIKNEITGCFSKIISLFSLPKSNW